MSWKCAVMKVQSSVKEAKMEKKKCVCLVQEVSELITRRKIIFKKEQDIFCVLLHIRVTPDGGLKCIFGKVRIKV